MTKKSIVKSIIAGVFAFSLIAGAVPNVIETAVPVSAAPVEQADLQGEWANGTWSFSRTTGTLTIGGTGTIAQSHANAIFTVVGNGTLATGKNAVKELVLEGGITEVGQLAFCQLYNLTKVTLPDGLTTIGLGSFYSLPKITELTIPSSVTSIGNSALAALGTKDGSVSLTNNSQVIFTEGMFKYGTKVYSGAIGTVVQADLTNEQIASYFTLFSHTTVNGMIGLTRHTLTAQHLHNDYTGNQIEAELSFTLNDEVISVTSDNFNIEGDTSAINPGEYIITVSPLENGTYFCVPQEFKWYIDERNEYNCNVDGGVIVKPLSAEAQNVYTDGELISVKADEPNENFGWYDVTDNDNPVLLSKGSTYSFFIHSDITLRYQQLAEDDREKVGAAKLYFSGVRGTIADDYITIPVHAGWELPDNATIIKGGTYRIFADEAPISKDDLIANGKFKATSKLESKRSFNYNINLSPSSSSFGKYLYVMTYVEAQIENENYVVSSNIVCLTPEEYNRASTVDN